MALDYEKRNRQERVHYTPSPRAQSATPRQIEYITNLAHRKGQGKPRLPKTKYGASEMIERLLDLPDVNERAPVRFSVSDPNEARVALIEEIRGHFPALTPMAVNSLLNLLMLVDELGTYFFFSEVPEWVGADTPDTLEELVPWILKAFLDWRS